MSSSTAHVTRSQVPSHLQRQAYELQPSNKLIDALVVRATGKPDSEIAQIVYEITERLKPMRTG